MITHKIVLIYYKSNNNYVYWFSEIMWSMLCERVCLCDVIKMCVLSTGFLRHVGVYGARYLLENGLKMAERLIKRSKQCKVFPTNNLTSSSYVQFCCFASFDIHTFYFAYSTNAWKYCMFHWYVFVIILFWFDPF